MTAERLLARRGDYHYVYVCVDCRQSAIRRDCFSGCNCKKCKQPMFVFGGSLRGHGRQYPIRGSKQKTHIPPPPFEVPAYKDSRGWAAIARTPRYKAWLREQTRFELPADQLREIERAIEDGMTEDIIQHRKDLLAHVRLLEKKLSDAETKISILESSLSQEELRNAFA